MPAQTIRLISAGDIRQCLTMDLAIQAMESAFAQLALQKAKMPQRIHLEIPEATNLLLVMPSYLADQRQIGVKVLNLCEKNADRGLPLIQAVVILIDVETGQTLAILDGASLTAIRTGAASGLATKYLARPDSEVAVVFGAGVQGRTQLEALCAVRPLRRCYVFDVRESAMRDYASEMSQKLGLDVIPAAPRSVLREADVLCTATNTEKPLFALSELKLGCHVNAIGSFKYNMHEIAEEVIAEARLVVDELQACLSETGDLIIPIEKGLLKPEFIHAELGELAAGLKPGRASSSELTLFKSVGLAIQDLAAGSMALRQAERLNLGTMVTL